MGFDLEQWMRSHGLDRKRAMSVLGLSKAGIHRRLRGNCGPDAFRDNDRWERHRIEEEKATGRPNMRPLWLTHLCFVPSMSESLA